MRNTVYQYLPPKEVDALVRSAINKNRKRRPKSPVHHRIDFEDLCQAVHLRLLEQDYDPTKSSPSTFITMCTNTELGMLFRKLSAESRGVFITEYRNITSSRPAAGFLLINLDGSLSELEREVVVLRGAHAATQREVAAELGVSIHRVRKAERAAYRTAKELSIP